MVEYPYKIVDLDQGSPEWHAWRSRGIGASDAPAIMDENPWKSREWLLKEKLNESKVRMNEAMRRGTQLEPEARSRYERFTGIKVRPVCLESKEIDWMRASLDGLAHDGNTVIEIKCGTSAYKHATNKGRPPGYYIGQLQHILAVTGLSRIDFWCYLPGRPEIHLPIDRDDGYIERLIETESKFWEELEGRR